MIGVINFTHVTQSEGFEMRTLWWVCAVAVLAGCSPTSSGDASQTTDAPQQAVAVAQKQYERIPTDHLAAESILKGMTREKVLERFGEPQEYRDVAGYGWASPALAYQGEFTERGKQKNTLCLYFKLNALGEPVVVDLHYH